MNQKNDQQSDAMKKIEIVNGAVSILLDNFAKVDTANASAQKYEGNQLHVLMTALKDYPEPMTEGVWDSLYRGNVSERLAAAKLPSGSLRYSSKASRDTIMSQLKCATIGLTLAKVDRAFEPHSKTTSLKKYDAWVRPLLQEAVDPATGQPRLKSIATTPKVAKPKKLPEGSSYWLIGCHDAEKGIGGANTVITGSVDLDFLLYEARRLSSNFASFLYVPAPRPEPLPTEQAKSKVQPVFQNSAVYGDSFSPLEVG